MGWYRMTIMMMDALHHQFLCDMTSCIQTQSKRLCTNLKSVNRWNNTLHWLMMALHSVSQQILRGVLLFPVATNWDTLGIFIVCFGLPFCCDTHTLCLNNYRNSCNHNVSNSLLHDKYDLFLQRVDGRAPFDYRDMKISFGEDYGCCHVSIGATM